MKDYEAWLNGYSVARGTLANVELVARKVYATPNWQEFEASKGPTTLKITRGARQLFVKAIVLPQA